MSYFLKKCTKKGRVYLSIVNGYHDPKKGYTVQETYKSFGTYKVSSINVQKIIYKNVQLFR